MILAGFRVDRSCGGVDVHQFEAIMESAAQFHRPVAADATPSRSSALPVRR